MKGILTTELEERELNAARVQLEKAESLARNKGTDQIIKPKRTNWFSEKREERAGKWKSSAFTIKSCASWRFTIVGKVL